VAAADSITQQASRRKARLYCTKVIFKTGGVNGGSLR